MTALSKRCSHVLVSRLFFLALQAAADVRRGVPADDQYASAATGNVPQRFVSGQRDRKRGTPRATRARRAEGPVGKQAARSPPNTEQRGRARSQRTKADEPRPPGPADDSFARPLRFTAGKGMARAHPREPEHERAGSPPRRCPTRAMIAPLDESR